MPIFLDSARTFANWKDARVRFIGDDLKSSRPFGVSGVRSPLLPPQGGLEMDNQQLKDIVTALKRLQLDLMQLRGNMEGRLTDLQDEVEAVGEDVEKILKRLEEGT